MGTLTINAWLGILITGAALLLGGFATATSILNARGPRERRFVLARCAGAWAAIVLLLFLVILTPFPWNIAWMILYFFHLPLAIYRFASKLQLLRVLESRAAARPAADRPGK